MKTQGESPTRYTVMEDTYNYIDAEYMLKMERKCNGAGEELAQVFNSFLRKYHLDGETALYLLARVSANAINSVQMQCGSPEERDAVEDRFQEVLDFSLGTFEMLELKELEKRKMS